MLFSFQDKLIEVRHSSLIGAIDNNVGLRHYYLFKGSNNTDKFLEFSRGLIAKIQHQASSIVMDNLSMHHSHAVRDLFRETKHAMHFLPSYSCNLNSIECLCCMVKCKGRQQLTENYMHKLNEEMVIGMIK